MIGPLACLLVGVGAILLFLLYFRLHPFLALLISALLCAFLSDQIPVDEAVSTVALGFADLMGQIGILLVLASLVGKALVESGAADRIIRSFTRLFGPGREHFSFLSSSFVLSMPVFFDTVFYLLAPLVRSAYARRKANYALMICAAAAGGAITHALVPPTPGPVVVSGALDVPLGITFAMGVVLSIVPAVVGGIWYAHFIDRRLDIQPRPVYGVSIEDMAEVAHRPDEELPSLIASLAPVAVPIGLIALATITLLVGDPDSTYGLIFSILGDKDVAFLLGCAVSIWLVMRQKGLSVRQVSELLEPALTAGTAIAFITCAGGAFGRVLTESGVGEVIAAAARDWGVSLLVLAFFVALLIRVAQGSATVSMITTAGIVAPAASGSEIGFHPVYLVAVIGFGATAASWMNDSGFWIVCKMSGMSEGETLKTWTVLLTVVAFSGFLWTWLLATLVPLV